MFRCRGNWFVRENKVKDISNSLLVRHLDLFDNPSAFNHHGFRLAHCENPLSVGYLAHLSDNALTIHHLELHLSLVRARIDNCDVAGVEGQQKLLLIGLKQAR